MKLIQKFSAAKADSEVPFIRGYDISYILRCVSQVESRILEVGGGRADLSEYIKVKEWLVQKQYLRSFVISFFLRNSKKKLPLFCLETSFPGIAKGLFLWLAGKRFTGETSAQAIRIKNNVRAYFTYAPHPFAVKVLISRTRSLENMKNEIHIREKIARYNTLNTPEMLNSDLSFDPPFLQEEVIWGENPQKGKDESIISEVFSPQLWSTYEEFGFQIKKLSEILDTSEFLRTFKRSINGVPWFEEYGDKAEFLDKVDYILNMEGNVPFGFVHGDLCLGNIIVTGNGNVYVVDWEQSGEGPTVFDLYEILTEFPSSRNYFEERINQVLEGKNSGDFLPFHIQFCLAALLKINKWSSNYNRAPESRRPGLKRRMARTIRYFDEMLAQKSS